MGARRVAHLRGAPLHLPAPEPLASRTKEAGGGEEGGLSAVSRGFSYGDWRKDLIVMRVFLDGEEGGCLLMSK